MERRHITAGSPAFAPHLDPAALVRGLWRRRDLLRQFTRREIRGRYRGARLGMLWVFVQPLVMLLIYTFVFGLVFRARWPGAQTESLAEFSVTLFAGLVVFQLFSECLGRAPFLVTGVPNYVKKVVFPLEILPVCSLGASLFHAAVNVLILLGAQVLVLGRVPLTALAAPLAVLPLLALSLGLGWYLASLGVFFRDLQQAVGLLITMLFFVTPIFYPLSAVPEPLRPLLRLNPLAFAVEAFRETLLWGRWPAWQEWTAWAAAGLAVLLTGYAFFMRTRRAFADVL